PCTDVRGVGMTRRLAAVAALAMLVGLSLAGAQSASGLGVFGAQQNDSAGTSDVSQNARVVVWETIPTNLSPDDADAGYDVYARDTDTGVTQLVSRSSGGGPKGNGQSRYPTVSADGRYVVFDSQATNLSP